MLIHSGRHVVIPAPAGLRVFANRGGAPAWEPDDWWTVSGKTCVAAYQSIGAPSLAASYTNVANPGTYDAADGVAPTFDTETGWTFNGSTQYLKVGITPGSSRTYSALARFSNSSGDTPIMIHTQNANPRLLIAADWFSMGRYYANGADAIGGAGVAAGVLAVAGNKAYYNGADESLTISDASGEIPEITIGGVIRGSTLFLNGKIQAVAIYSDTLTSEQVATVSTAMAAL